MVSIITKKVLPLFLIAFIAGIVLTILGPLGTNRVNLTTRAAYWIGLCLAGGLGTGLIDIIAAQFKWSLKNWQLTLGQSIGATLCVTTVLFILYPPRSMLGILLTFFYVWVIAIIICSFGTLIYSRKTDQDNTVTADKRPDILERLSPHLRSGEIYAISAEDHYVRVHTSLGDEMVLMRLSDAIKEVSPLIGEKTHRSWWVAEAGIKKVKRDNGKVHILLKNEAIVPVSRSGQKHIKEAGWI